MLSFIHHMLVSLLICVLWQEPTIAIKQSYIVYLGSHSFGPNPSSFDIESATNSHYDFLGSYLGSTEKAKEAIFYSYNKNINGFAAILDEDEATKIAKNPNVISIFLNKKHKLQTTHSWNFLQLESNGEIPKDSIWKRSFGEDIIIANLDTGVWPESKSFSDEGIGTIPKKWRGICQVDNQNQDKFYCNRKLIGARYFYKGYGKDHQNESFNSARDFEGHGSHTLSTAGGSFVANANVFGYGNGTVSGGSPKARVVSYKVCWSPDTGCYDADILAAFEASISDGVDVLSISLGSNQVEYYETGQSIGSFHAVANGITVVSAATNYGPYLSSVGNLEPWVFTVAASTIDREFNSFVTLGNNKTLKGASFSEMELQPHKMYPLISGADAKYDNASSKDALNCTGGTLDPRKAKGKILFCLHSQDDCYFSCRIHKGVEAARVGAVGMILANDENSGSGIQADPHVLPSSYVNFIDGSYIFNYINHTKSPVASISKVVTQIPTKPAPYIAFFSARGPNPVEPTILKPDITAPGVNIIAAYSEAISPSEQASDKRRTPFNVMSGTSMSCPHVAGLVGLLKSIHPDWSPAAIKSAIMTTATTEDNTGGPILDSSLEKATPFDYGAGHVQPNRAVDPGLVYDLNVTDYMNFLCARGYNSSMLKLFYGKPYTCPKSFNLKDFNYPAITILDFKVGQSINVTRTLTNVGSPSKYTAHIQAPPEFVVSIEPKVLNFNQKGDKKEFRVTLSFSPKSKGKSDYVFGRLIWTNGMNNVGIPIALNYPY
ncbi:hypothetical protein P8452_70897 [Trifolium repens]|nr:hypothetical protein P8452_70897 [Trifolium repens]